jgi:hypothetical protein
MSSCLHYITTGIIIVHAEIEYKRNIDLFYSLNVYEKRVIYHFANIIKTLTKQVSKGIVINKDEI